MNFLLFQHESEVKSERAIGNLTSDLENEATFRPGSKTPYGYNQIEKQLQPNANADIVTFIFFLSSWGKSLQKIALILNEAKIPSPKGGIWRSSSVENILKNPVYLGDLIWDVHKRKDNGQKQFYFEKAHKPIVSHFYLELINQNNQLQKTFGRIDTPFLFLNKVKCRQCNQNLYTTNGSTKRNGVKYSYHYYVCKNCGYKYDIDEVHDKFVPLVLKHIKELISSKWIIPNTLTLINDMCKNIEQSIETKNQLIKKLEEKLKIAQSLKDRELEVKVIEFLQQHKVSLKEFSTCKENLKTSYQLVKNDQFFSRFDEILEHQLGQSEIRLVILYFVDYLILSDQSEPGLIFKSNIFSDLVNSITG